MSLDTDIDSRLWSAISKSYLDGNFSGAISDGFYFLSDLIRTKSGCDSDGHALIAAAFGGDNPVLKVNTFRTESERSEQRGIEQLLRGLYTSIRNPRSHEKRVDTIATGNAVLGFMNFLIVMIDRSRSPFDEQQILTKILDKHFVNTKQYAIAIVETVPAGKRFDIVSRVFEKRCEGDIEHVSVFTNALLETLPPDAQKSYWEMVSECLEVETATNSISTAVKIASNNWTDLFTVTRLRIENRLIKSIQEGLYDSESGACKKGALGTWASGVGSSFTTKAALH